VFTLSILSAIYNRQRVPLYRANFGQRGLITIWPDFVNWNTATDVEAIDWATTRTFGMRAKSKRPR
jgi:uncharacterized protein